jgi:GMP synthase-like glutamine amidotransferase
MKHVSVVQHTSAEWLGGIEDHFEARGIRFGYFRPFATAGTLPRPEVIGDGLVLLGGGPWGSRTEGRPLPTLEAEVRLARACLMLDKPVLGFGVGAQILSLAAEGESAPAPLAARLASVRRVMPDALGGLMPDTFPAAVYMRDVPVPPSYADVLAVDETGAAAVFQIGRHSFGFIANPGMRRAMLEDLVMEFEEAPEDVGQTLEAMGRAGTAIEDALVPLMAGLVKLTGWM